MPDFFYKCVITGEGPLENPSISLEGRAISLVSSDGKKTWRNKGKSVKISVAGLLQIAMSCQAPGRVDYVFKVDNSDGNGKIKCNVFTEDGFTGDSGAGFSEKSTSVKPDCSSLAL